MTKFILEPDSFDRRAREMQQKTAPKCVPVMVVDIPRSGSWSRNNQLGREAAFAPDANNRQTVLKLDEWGPPEVWTIGLGLVNTLTSYNGFSVVGEIDFGVGGATQRIEVDWVNGTQITVPMNALNVIARWQDIDTITEGRGLKLRVTLARGPRPGELAPVRTIVENVLLNAGQEFFADVPAFTSRVFVRPSTSATALTFLAGSADANAFVVTLNRDRPASALPMLASTLTDMMQNGLPVFGSGRALKFRNGGAVAGTFSAWAELSL
jgi:hypothetical protein